MYAAPVRRLAVLAALYLAQGLPFGFFSHAVPVLLNREHPPEIVGLSSLLALPWGLKFLWAPWVDRVVGARFGKRKTVLLPLQALTVIALVLIGFSHVDDKHLTPLLVGFSVVSLLSATQDIATDALSIDLLSPAERGRGGAVQTGAYRAGMIAGGGGVLAMIDYVGYREAFLLMAAIVAAATIPLIGLREPAASQRDDDPTREVGTSRTPSSLSLLTGFFRRPNVWRTIGMLFCFKLGDALAAGMVTRWFVKSGLSTADIATSRALVGGLCAIAGSIAGGWAAQALGRRRALIGLGALQAAAIALYWVLATLRPIGGEPWPLSVFYVASVVEHLLGGAATAALFTKMMDDCRDGARATDFTLQSCVLVGVTGLGLVGSGLVTKLVGLTGLFAVASLLGALAPLGVRWFYSAPKPPGAAPQRA